MKNRSRTPQWVRMVAILALMGTAMIGATILAGRPTSSPQGSYGFSPPQNLSNSTGYDASQRPRLSAGPGLVHVVWMEGVLNNATGPAHSEGDSDGWTPWEWIGPHASPGYTNPDIAISPDGTAHAVWAAAHPPYDIFYSSRSPGGSWSAPLNLSNESYNSVYPSVVATSDGGAWVVWQASVTEFNTELYLARLDPVQGWLGPERLTYNSWQDLNPRLVIGADDTLHLVWRSNQLGGIWIEGIDAEALGGNWEVFYRAREPGGSWSPAFNVSATGGASHFPDIAEAGGTLYVVWEEEIGSNWAIVFRRMDAGGWSAPISLAVGGRVLYPAVSAENELVAVAWVDYSAGTEIHFTLSSDGGESWGPIENVSQNISASFYPDVLLVGGMAYVIWQDTAAGQLDIWYSYAEVGPGPTPIPSAPPTPEMTAYPSPADVFIPVIARGYSPPTPTPRASVNVED